MTINLTELRDEPLGKHPSQAIPYAECMQNDTEQDVVAADHESISTFDVDGLSDEALDPPRADRPSVHFVTVLLLLDAGRVVAKRRGIAH